MGEYLRNFDMLCDNHYCDFSTYFAVRYFYVSLYAVGTRHMYWVKNIISNFDFAGGLAMRIKIQN